jgi:hypothetical protein
MRRFVIAICALLLAPSSVMACYEDHGLGAGWFDDGSSNWTKYGTGARPAQRNKLMDLSIFAGGSGVLILLGVGMRTLLRSAQQPEFETIESSARVVPLALPNDGPPCDPQCVLAGPDSQDDDWTSAKFLNPGDDSWTDATLPIESFHCLV